MLFAFSLHNADTFNYLLSVLSATQEPFLKLKLTYIETFFLSFFRNSKNKKKILVACFNIIRNLHRPCYFWSTFFNAKKKKKKIRLNFRLNLKSDVRHFTYLFSLYKIQKEKSFDKKYSKLHLCNWTNFFSPTYKYRYYNEPLVNKVSFKSFVFQENTKDIKL